jgi:hypothetical protein
MHRDSSGFARPQVNLLKTLELLERSRDRRVHRRHIKLSGLRAGASPGVSDPKADSNKTVIVPFLIVGQRNGGNPAIPPYSGPRKGRMEGWRSGRMLEVPGSLAFARPPASRG